MICKTVAMLVVVAAVFVRMSSSWPFSSATGTVCSPPLERCDRTDRGGGFRGTSGVRRSSLDPAELVPSFDEVWTEGVTENDAWSWRPMFDLFHTLMGMDFLYRAYVLEMGAPNDRYASMECDLIRWTGMGEADSWWGHEMRRAKAGDFVQIIDNPGSFCSFSPPFPSMAGYDMRRSCQLDASAAYSTQHSPNGADVGQYLFSIETPAERWSEFVHLHELLHVAQYVHMGQRLYMEHPDDGEVRYIRMVFFG